MRYPIRALRWLGCTALIFVSAAQAAGNLLLTDAWIRQPPPGAEMLAGYVTLANDGDQPLTVLTAQSNAFRMTSLHETVMERGVAKMRELSRLVIEPGESLRFAPGGRHLMFMHPRRPIAVGDRVEVNFLLADGTRAKALFDVLAADAGNSGQ